MSEAKKAEKKEEKAEKIDFFKTFSSPAQNCKPLNPLYLSNIDMSGSRKIAGIVTEDNYRKSPSNQRENLLAKIEEAINNGKKPSRKILLAALELESRDMRDALMVQMNSSKVFDNMVHVFTKIESKQKLAKRMRRT